MEDILDSIVDAIHDFLVDLCGGIFIGIFDDANAATGEIAAEVGLTPSGWNASIFNMIQNLSNNVIIPIAGMIITFVLCYELITTITEKNNMHDVDTFIFFKYVFKGLRCGISALAHLEITIAIFDVGQWVVNQAATSITNDTYVDVLSMYNSFRYTLDGMDCVSLSF